ncbi:hypothetical protein KGP87_06040 [Burkholderia multivorans]|uniref:hypothetical protein n=1 Tax=Burkholderia multivorans TaxID=87883 RepID=UPI0020A498E1|nr:hypothetical protein [Burkholderia multivorans]MCO8575885.1 hypothetical protein [Burkholderia multivorans]
MCRNAHVYFIEKYLDADAAIARPLPGNTQQHRFPLCDERTAPSVGSTVDTLRTATIEFARIPVESQRAVERANISIVRRIQHQDACR